MKLYLTAVSNRNLNFWTLMKLIHMNITIFHIRITYIRNNNYKNKN